MHALSAAAPQRGSTAPTAHAHSPNSVTTSAASSTSAKKPQSAPASPRNSISSSSRSQAPRQNAINTIGYLAARLALRHHSLVELATRCEEAGWLVRRPGTLDRRIVVLHLTPAGSRILHELSEDHEQELHELAPQLIEALSAFTRRPGARAQP